MSTCDREKVILNKIFHKYDTDRDGFLLVSDFIRLLLNLSRHVKELKGQPIILIANALFSIIDDDEDGKLSFEEFRKWWNSHDKYKSFCSDKADQLLTAYKLFNNFTKESSNKLTHSDLCSLMEELGFEDFDDLFFDDLDVDNDGKVSFEEFCDWLNWF